MNAEKSGLGKTSPHAAPLSQRENRGQAAYLTSKEQPLGFFTWCSSSSNSLLLLIPSEQLQNMDGLQDHWNHVGGGRRWEG